MIWLQELGSQAMQFDAAEQHSVPLSVTGKCVASDSKYRHRALSSPSVVTVLTELWLSPVSEAVLEGGLAIRVPALDYANSSSKPRSWLPSSRLVPAPRRGLTWSSVL